MGNLKKARSAGNTPGLNVGLTHFTILVDCYCLTQ